MIAGAMPVLVAVGSEVAVGPWAAAPRGKERRARKVSKTAKPDARDGMCPCRKLGVFRYSSRMTPRPQVKNCKLICFWVNGK